MNPPPRITRRIAAAVGLPSGLRADDLADIRDPLWVWTSLETGLAIAGALLLLALVGLFYFIQRRRAQPPAEPVFTRADLFTRTRDALAELRARAPDLEAAPFAVEASAIMRAFLESSLDIAATDRTTEEFLESLRHHKALEEEAQGHLTAFLAQCDLAKYARQELPVESRFTLIEAARSLVDAVENRNASESLAAPHSH